jgi:hypothetical protein
VLLVGVLYCSIGIVFGNLGGSASSHQLLLVSRWAAWVVSAILVGGHIVYEQVRLRSSPRITALHVSSAAGLGAFGLAVAANVHAQTLAAHQAPLLLILSLVIWPVMTALPAFVVALVAAMLLAQVWRSNSTSGITRHPHPPTER